MALESGADFDARHPLGAGEQAGIHEERRTARPWYLGMASLACPTCDAPVALAEHRATPTDELACPFCRHDGAVRDFVSLTPPLRTPRVHVYVRY